MAEIDDMANAYVHLDHTTVRFSTPCLICEESVEVSFSEQAPKICYKCKAAVLAMRANTESGKKE